MDSDINPYKCNNCTEKFSDIKQAQTHFFNNHVNNVVKTEEIQQLESTIKIEKSSPVKSEQNEDSNDLKIFHIGRFWNRLLLTFLDSIAVSICEVFLVDKQAESDTWAKSKKSNKAGSKTSKHRLLYIYMCV